MEVSMSWKVVQPMPTSKSSSQELIAVVIALLGQTSGYVTALRLTLPSQQDCILGNFPINL